MASCRRRLRLFATTCLVLQVAWLIAIVPSDCCPAHRAVQSERRCHQQVGANQCPMRTANGQPCPMHRGSSHHAHQNLAGDTPDGTQTAPDSCVLRGACGGPMAAFLTLRSAHGILPVSPVVGRDLELRSVTVASRHDPVGHVDSPEPPPPRS